MKKILFIGVVLLIAQATDAALHEMFPQEKNAGGGIMQMAAPQGGGGFANVKAPRLH